MTEFEVRLSKALARCSFLPGSSHKRFCKNLAFVAEHSPDKEISLRQRHYLELMAWRYRRQLPDDVIPHSKPLNLPRAVPVKTKKEKVSPQADVGQSKQGNLL